MYDDSIKHAKPYNSQKVESPTLLKSPSLPQQRGQSSIVVIRCPAPPLVALPPVQFTPLAPIGTSASQAPEKTSSWWGIIAAHGTDLTRIEANNATPYGGRSSFAIHTHFISRNVGSETRTEEKSRSVCLPGCPLAYIAFRWKRNDYNWLLVNASATDLPSTPHTFFFPLTTHICSPANTPYSFLVFPPKLKCRALVQKAHRYCTRTSLFCPPAPSLRTAPHPTHLFVFVRSEWSNPATVPWFLPMADERQPTGRKNGPIPSVFSQAVA